MLDAAIREQLESVFAKLEGSVEFVYEPSEHSSQPELIEFLSDIAATSPRLAVKSSAGAPSSAALSLGSQWATDAPLFCRYSSRSRIHIADLGDFKYRRKR